MNREIDNALDELLLVRPATDDDIVQAYRRMAKRFHPDKATDPDEKKWVQKKFLRVQQAYDFLKALSLERINAQEDVILQNTEPEKCQTEEEVKPEKPWSVVPTALAVFIGLPVAMVVLSCLGATFLKPTAPKQASGVAKKTVSTIDKDRQSTWLIGHWRCGDIHEYYKPVDHSTGVGDYTREDGTVYAFKILAEQRWPQPLTIREYWPAGNSLAVPVIAECSISYDGWAMTKTYTFENGKQMALRYRHVDGRIGPSASAGAEFLCYVPRQRVP